MKKIIAIITLVFILAGCSVAIDGEKYRSLTPTFNPYHFFDGKVVAWGIVQDRDGNLIQQFKVNIDGSVDGNGALVLDETFSYLVGEGVTKRIWTIEQTATESYSGTASDILSAATGQTFGNAMNWRYEMDLPVDDTSYVVEFDDWMWAFNDDTLMNRSYIKKFGIVMAEVTIFMKKQ
ncbi:DUF3833 family protein (plasmid) [Pseudoalteromonas sp. T1lg65]|uniref:DUF3833 family protein n=1 Tax=Pseudoalteromonas sp. T1lg65 TaxID=2077101 RepID=UPI003F78D383